MTSTQTSPKETLASLLDKIANETSVVFRAFYQTTHSNEEESSFDMDTCVRRAKQIVESILTKFDKPIPDVFLEPPLDEAELDDVRDVLESQSKADTRNQEDQ